MKKLLGIIFAFGVLVCSCNEFDDTEIWDNIHELDDRLTKLEQLCKEMNTNINALQALVEAQEKNDYITNVTPVTQGGEVIGYTISFAYGDPITIYHGINGADGQQGLPGEDGSTPVIGVEMDDDGLMIFNFI